MNDQDHDRLLKLEAMIEQWIQSVRREIDEHRKITYWLVMLVGASAASVVVWLLQRGV